MAKAMDRWVFNGPPFFSHSTTNSCGVATGFSGKYSFDLIDQMCDENGCILRIEAKINEDNFIIKFITLIPSQNN